MKKRQTGLTRFTGFFNRKNPVNPVQDSPRFTTIEAVACVVAGLFLAALQIVFFTPVVFGGNQR